MVETKIITTLSYFSRVCGVTFPILRTKKLTSIFPSFHVSMFPCFHLSSFALPGPISTQNKRSKATTQALDLLTILKKLQNIQLRFTLPLIFDAEVNYCFNYAEDS